MRVAIDGQIFAFQEHGGISRLFAELAGQFLADPMLGVSLQTLNCSSSNRHALDDPRLRKALNIRQARGQHVALARYLVQPKDWTGVDLVHSTFYLSSELPKVSRRPHVVTVHDMIPELFTEKRRRADWITNKKKYVERANHVICVSESTKNDLLSIFGDLQVPISVIPHGVSPRFSPTSTKIAGLPDDFVLHVGIRDGYKDGDTLIKAFALVASEFPNLHLLLVGGGRLSGVERQRIRHLRVESRVLHWLASDDELPTIYSSARAFVFPSRYEGFGLPVLESMACGTPTILAKASSLPEVGGTSARYFPVGDEVALAERLVETLNVDKASDAMVEAGRVRAKEFSWRTVAERTRNVYREVLGDGHEAHLDAVGN